MKLLIALALLVVAAYALPSEDVLQENFLKFTRQYNKVYSHEDFLKRYTIYKDNAKFVEDHNAKGLSFKVALNQFADLTAEEFAGIYNGLIRKEYTLPNVTNEVQILPGVPTSYDWRTQGYVTGVKDQGQCGSCWSFSATGSTEGSHFKNTGTLVSLSEQNLVDCSSSYGNMGCNGGLMDFAFKYIINNGGIDTEASYPYTAMDGTCHYSKSNCGSTLQSYQDIPQGDEVSLLNDCASTGPISVAIDASHSSFQFYSSGVYYEAQCSATRLDHGVLVVGWGVSGSQDYWIVKNSWGATWGLNGYIWMSRNRNNNCGIATASSFPLGAGNC
uniref:Cathepsin L n=1 Tax=Stereomyxa ramosa TaxID=1078864 RepID=A0A7S2EYV9_9EUKA|mmetsp:Transcript_207/g.241  ORF Transcript_207/g.241 Transcript_207/m.241 type:complete len:330 (+) Transcript_207:1-990(+)